MICMNAAPEIPHVSVIEKILITSTKKGKRFNVSNLSGPPVTRIAARSPAPTLAMP
jgi:hypothetical protein